MFAYMQELAAPFGIETPVNESTVFDDIITKWTNQRAENEELQKKLTEEREKTGRVEEALKVKALSHQHGD